MNFAQAQGQHDCQQPPNPQPIKCAMNDCSNMIQPGDGVDIGNFTRICDECSDSHCVECWSATVKVPGSICEECRQAAMEDRDE